MATWSFVFVSTISPALKSIHPALYPASFELEEIFMVGTRVAKGVPLPVSKKDNLGAGYRQGRGRYQIITRSGQQVKALLPDAFAVLQHTAHR